MSLLLPVDGCPRCITTDSTALAHPDQVVTLPDGDGLRAWYHCPRCRNSWDTYWSLEAIRLPCPGCAVCQRGSGAA